MPNLFRLRQEGVWCANAIPFSRRSTRERGQFPLDSPGGARHCVEYDVCRRRGSSAFRHRGLSNLVRLAGTSGGRRVAVPTLAETLEKAGVSFAALGSGSAGSGFLLSPMAPVGIGTLISVKNLEEGRRRRLPR